MRTVEAKGTGLDRRQAASAVGATEMDAVKLLVPALGPFSQRQNAAAGELERQVETLGDSGTDAFADRDPVDYGFDRVRPGLRKLRGLVGHLDHLAVHPRTNQARAADRLKNIE